MWILLSILNVVFAYYAEKSYDVNKAQCKFFLFLIVVANVIILGLRDIGVGFDTNVYIELYFQEAKKISGFRDLFFTESEGDKGFLLLAWVSTLLGNDPRILMFITELFIISFVIIGIYKSKKLLNYNITWFVLLFVLCFQHDTINLMRQFCAMSILFYGYSFILQKRYGAYLICQGSALLFHTTSLVLLLVLLLHLSLNSSKEIQKIALLSIAVILLLFLFFYFKFVDFLHSTGLMQSLYFNRYGEDSNLLTDGAMGMAMPLLLGIQILIYIFAKKTQCILPNYLYMLLTLSMFTIVFQFASFYTIKNLYRLGYYFYLILIMYYASMFQSKKISITVLSYLFVMMTMYLQVKSIYNDYVNHNPGCTVYKSEILGIK